MKCVPERLKAHLFTANYVRAASPQRALESA
jgi:hypothetical protein